MKILILAFCILTTYAVSAQTDTSVNNLMNSMDQKTKLATATPVKVFNSLRLINANTVELLKKGFMEFKVIHDFGDIAGKNGGIHHFFGLDDASDVKIAFQVGLSDKLNIVAARAKGGGAVQELWELGFKYKIAQQEEHDPSHPVSVSIYVNGMVATQKADTSAFSENKFANFSDRLSQLVQVLVARKFGNISVQLNPTYIHTDYVVPGDVKNIFAIGGGLRLPVLKKLVLIADYFHSFRSQANRDALAALGTHLYDAFGVGVEILTPGHVFHMNFTNTTNIMDNRLIPRTFTSWGKGQYRWGFTIGRNFILFRDHKKTN